MDQLIQFLAEALGIPYQAVEGSVATLAFLLVGFLLKLLWDASKRDNKQVDLESTLAQLAIKAVQSYENNNKLIADISGVLKTMRDSFENVVGELKEIASEVKTLTSQTQESRPLLDGIRENLFKTSETVVVIKDIEDNELGRATIKPEGEELVVYFEAVKEKSDVTGMEKSAG